MGALEAKMEVNDMNYNLNNPIAKRATKVVYEDEGNTIKLFNEGYPKADIFNEAMNHARVEEGTNLNMSRVKEVVCIDKKLGIVYEYIKGRGGDITPPNVVTIDIINIASAPNINFETDAQIDEFLEKIKNELKNKLQDADIVNLKL